MSDGQTWERPSLRPLLMLEVMQVWELLFPVSCLACGSPKRAGFGLCEDCLDQVQWEGTAGCVRCGRAGCGHGCVPLRHRYRRVLAVAAYRRSWRRLILALKRGRDRQVARQLGRFMGELASAAGMPRPELVVPAPGAAPRPGFQLVPLLAYEVARQAEADVFSGLLRRPGRLPQVELDRSHRLEGLAEYLTVSDSAQVAGRLVWLVDDVFTTGGTAAACSQVLLAAGAAEVWVLVAAA